MAFDPDRLAAAVDSVDGWSQPSTLAATGVHHGYRRVVVVSGGRRQAAAAPFGWVLDEYRPIREAWLSWIDPGGFILPHADAGPHRERWQVPIRPAGWFRQADDWFQPEAGVPFQVAHWLEHEVVNPTDHPRIHLVIDRDVTVRPTRTQFRVYLKAS